MIVEIAKYFSRFDGFKNDFEEEMEGSHPREAPALLAGGQRLAAGTPLDNRDRPTDRAVIAL